jgi:uncharacterized membrane protein
VPIYTVGVGSTEDNPAAGPPRMDIAAVEAPIQAVVRNTMHLHVTVHLTGKAGRTHRLSLRDSAGEELASQDVWTDQPAGEMTFRLPYTPTPAQASQGARDVRKLSVVLAEKTGQEQPVRHQQAPIHLLLTRPEIRVVYLEGSIRPEYKFLRRYFDSDPNLQLMALIRMTGSRFWAQGSLGKTRLTHLPASDEDFSLFDVLVIGDLDASYLTAEQMRRIDRFVEDGGGLLMIGGRSSFGPGGYGGTAIEGALPVVMGPRGVGQETEPFVPQLTAAGQAHPIFEGIEGFFRGPGGRAPSEETDLPPLQGCVRTIRAKAGTALAIHPDRRNQAGPLTVLAAQRYGAGRSAAFTGDTTWSWYLQMRGLGARSPYARFWGQLIRWLAGAETAKRDAEPAVVGRLSPTRSSYRVGDRITLRCGVRDASGQTTPDAVVTATATLEGSDLPAKVIPLAYSAAAGTYEGQFMPDRDGRWNLEFAARSGDEPLGSDTLAARIEAHQAELESTARRQDLLAELAGRSGGRSLELGRLGALVDELIAVGQARKGAGPQTDRASLHPLALLFILFCAAVTVEWLLRRRWQLA